MYFGAVTVIITMRPTAIVEHLHLRAIKIFFTNIFIIENV